MRVISILVFLICFITTLSGQQTPIIMDSLVISDNAGNRLALKFGIDPSASDTIDWQFGEALLPPPPPQGAFDVRFYLPKNNFNGNLSSYFDFRQGSIPFTGSIEHRIKMQKGSNDTIKFTYNFAEPITIRLQDGYIGTLIDTVLTGSGTYINPNPLLYELFKLTINYDNATDVKEEQLTVNDYKLYQNYPNPFNPSTMISFNLKENSDVSIKIFNAIGQQTALLINQYFSAGTHMLNFDANNLPAGVYFYQIIAGEFTQTKKMILLK